jgi:hypothetical protein
MLRHADLTSQEITGDTPAAKFFNDVLDPLDYYDRSALWAGCLDAPEAICSGGCKAVVIHGIYEGTVARAIER